MSNRIEVGPGTELRITRPESYARIDNAGHTDTTARQGHYIMVETTASAAIRKMLRNECHDSEVFQPGECVDVEVKYGHYYGRFRLNSDGDLVRLPDMVLKTTGGESPFIQLREAATELVNHVRTMPTDNEKGRHLSISLNNRPGELLIEALELLGVELTPAKTA